MQVTDVYNIWETNYYGADKPMVIIRANLGFEPRIVGSWHAQGDNSDLRRLTVPTVSASSRNTERQHLFYRSDYSNSSHNKQTRENTLITVDRQ